MILTAQNATPENKAIFLQEYREYRDKSRLVIRTSMSLAKTPPVDFTQDPPAIVAAKQRIAARLVQVNMFLKHEPQHKSLIKFITDHGLHYEKLNAFQHRIYNPRNSKFVDWWNGKKQTMRRADGSFGQQGKAQAFLLQEIARLVDLEVRH